MKADLREDEPIEVQMAPLIDCVFLLLIFFLVASTLKKLDKELPLELPDSQAAIEVQQPDDVLIVAIDHEGMFYLDGTPIALSLLQNNLRARGRENPDGKIRVDADRRVPFEYVMQIMDMLRFEGLNNAAINTRREETKYW